MRHHLTIDVEEHFQVSALEPHVARREWQTLESRVAPNMCRMLDLLARHDTRATCFILGWVAERHPDLVRRIAAAGHEVASHGWDHRRVTQQTPAEFRDSVRSTKTLLEQLTGRPVIGFRAPSFSIVPGTEWALDILIEEGYEYDSSLFPVARPGYGYGGAPNVPNLLLRPPGSLAEFPPATLPLMGLNLPAGGGAYFRLLPYNFTRSSLMRWQQQGISATFYIHPWEWDPDQPRFDVPWTTRLRHYGGLRRTWPRLQRMLREFRFTPIADTLNEVRAEDIHAVARA